jgi:2,3-bisphosphoglycerate-independent phosphoglycerate mutase
VLCVLDGWGYRTDETENAITPTNAPAFQRLWAENPSSLLETCGIDVGLPPSQMGNSEVGHMNLGAGRIVNQDIQRIDAAIGDGSITSNLPLKNYIEALKSSGGTCHLMGLLSPGGVHSHQDHLAKLAAIMSESGVPVSIHMFLDGRDTPPSSAERFVDQFQRQTATLQSVSLATLCGRFYAMDRDNRWDRVERAYNLLVSAAGTEAPDAASAIQASYSAEITDEFAGPIVLGNYSGMQDGDGILMGNFRADRAREILQALCDPEFNGFDRDRIINFASNLGVTEYSTNHNNFMGTMFPPLPLSNILGEIISNAGKQQLRIAETEKYAHVTFFFNCGKEEAFEGEDRILIQSPKVTTYDLQPEMSAPELTDALIEKIKGGGYDFILVNYANPDMVGHTGILEAAEIAIQTVDNCLSKLETAICEIGGTILITADHGNAEIMRDAQTGAPHTAHTLNAVPAVLVNAPPGTAGLRNGRLADIAPTILQLIGLEIPPEMTGISLLENASTIATEADRRVRA